MSDKDNPLGIRPFDAAEYLDSEEAIAEFLNVSFESGSPRVIVNALGTVARARGMTQLARDSGLGRESLYKALAPDAHPRFETIVKLMGALHVGLRAVSLAPHHTSEPGATYAVDPVDAEPAAKTGKKKREPNSRKPLAGQRAQSARASR